MATPRSASPLFEVADLVVEFATDDGPPARAVDGVGLEIWPGEVVALVGESGCGKSATAAAITRLLPATATSRCAAMRLGELDLAGWPERRWPELRGRRLGLVLQEPGAALHPVRRVGDQLVETLRVRRGLGRRAARAAAVDWLRRVGIPAADERFHAYPHELSGGMKQRVALALALCLDPDLLVADEPTTALDVTVQAQLLALFRGRVTSGAASVLLVTHDLGVVAETADRVCVMYAGRIVEVGPVEAIFARPRHPYTRALLDCRPRVRAPGAPRAPFGTIPGAVPRPTDRPPGCAFHPRCPRATERCRRDDPPRAAQARHRFACHHPLEAAAAGRAS